MTTPGNDPTPSGGTDLALVPPAAVAVIQGPQAEQMIDIDAAAKTKLDAMADNFATSLVTLDSKSAEFMQKVDAVHEMGDREIRESSNVSNRMLERPVRAMDSGLFDKKSPVAKSLVDLRETVTDLDPSKHNLFSPKKLLGLIPFGDRIRDYFLKYQSAQKHLDAILNTLYRSQDELRQDNAAVEQEKVNLWTIMGQLRQYIYLAAKLDSDVEAKINSIATSDPERAKVLKEDVLFYVRQKHQDLLTQMAVSAQGYLALDLIRKNNIELVKGVDRATTTTVSALRTAVMVAQALANQKLVLDQIQALNTTTGNLIESTSEMLRDQTGRVYEQASGSTVAVDKLKAAFANIYASMDAIDQYKVQALNNMKQTVDSLSTELQKAQTYLERVKSSDDSARTSGELALPSGPAS
jgi:uncharacterized protein YaaN involved in tellurite resistance